MRLGLVVVPVLIAAGLAAGPVRAEQKPDDAALAKQVLDAAGMRVGLCVHLGCGREASAGLTAELAAQSGMLVHGLAVDDASLMRARKAIDAKGVSGRAMVEKVSVNPLPYLRDLADLVVIEDFTGLAAQGLTMEEVQRVLAPNGSLCTLKDGRWTKTVKPRPKEMDEWTHPYHGADGNIVSTDEVFGTLGETGAFSETTPYDPSSPYAASKAASDHLVRAWGRTYGLPALITNCSNNYGPYQFPEKLVPLMILRALKGQPLPVYGSGENIRDWLYVEDHAEALVTVLTRGAPGSTYNIGAAAERRNIDMVEIICDLLDELAGLLALGRRRALITFVEDRPAHDKRYAIDAAKARADFGWRPAHDLAAGLRLTVQWYLDNEVWWRPLIGRGDALGRRGLPNTRFG